jgi:hypothetical protein
MRVAPVGRASQGRWVFLAPRLTPTACSHYHASRNQRSPNSIGGAAEVLAKLGQHYTASVEFGSGRDVIVGESLTTHLYTMAMQDRDDAALLTWAKLVHIVAADVGECVAEVVG